MGNSVSTTAAAVTAVPECDHTVQILSVLDDLKSALKDGITVNVDHAEYAKTVPELWQNVLSNEDDRLYIYAAKITPADVVKLENAQIHNANTYAGKTILLFKGQGQNAPDVDITGVDSTCVPWKFLSADQLMYANAVCNEHLHATTWIGNFGSRKFFAIENIGFNELVDPAKTAELARQREADNKETNRIKAEMLSHKLAQGEIQESKREDTLDDETKKKLDARSQVLSEDRKHKQEQIASKEKAEEEAKMIKKAKEQATQLVKASEATAAAKTPSAPSGGRRARFSPLS
jgi:hypothetical protein